MAEGLQTPDGQKVEVTEQDFARAMAAPEPDEPVAAAPPRKDPLAPYGLTKDGQPKRGPGGRPARYDAPRAAKAAPATAGAESPQAAAKRRSDGVKGFVQSAATGTAFVYTLTQDTAFYADSITLTSFAEPLAEACAQTAAVSPGFAKLIDKIAKVGPYGALTTVVLGLSAQLAANHGVRLPLPGVMAPADLIAAFERQNEPQDAADASPAHTAS